MLYFNDPEAFYTHLTSDIYTLVDEAAKMDLKPAVRCNGTSDLPRVAIKMAERFPQVQFYDYTKIFSYAAGALHAPQPSNLHLTFSRSEDNEDNCLRILREGGNVSVVFATDRRPLPTDHWGFPVIDGDKHDLRFLDPKGIVVGLSPKGPLAKADTSGFIVRTI